MGLLREHLNPAPFEKVGLETPWPLYDYRTNWHPSIQIGTPRVYEDSLRVPRFSPRTLSSFYDPGSHPAPAAAHHRRIRIRIRSGRNPGLQVSSQASILSHQMERLRS